MKTGPNTFAGPRQSLATAVAKWAGAPPPWVEALAREADHTSQTAVAKAIGYSGSVVSAVIARAYKGDFEAVEKAFKGRFQAQTVVCPVAGEIGSDVCLGHQKRAKKFHAASSVRVAFYRACRGGCPHSRIGKEDAS